MRGRHIFSVADVLVDPHRSLDELRHGAVLELLSRHVLSARRYTHGRPHLHLLPAEYLLVELLGIYVLDSTGPHRVRRTERDVRPGHVLQRSCDAHRRPDVQPVRPQHLLGLKHVLGGKHERGLCVPLDDIHHVPRRHLLLRRGHGGRGPRLHSLRAGLLRARRDALVGRGRPLHGLPAAVRQLPCRHFLCRARDGDGGQDVHSVRGGQLQRDRERFDEHDDRFHGVPGADRDVRARFVFFCPCDINDGSHVHALRVWLLFRRRGFIHGPGHANASMPVADHGVPLRLVLLGRVHADAGPCLHPLRSGHLLAKHHAVDHHREPCDGLPVQAE